MTRPKPRYPEKYSQQWHQSYMPFRDSHSCESDNHHDISKYHADFTLTNTSQDSHYAMYILHEDDDNMPCFRGARRWSSRCFHCCCWVHTLAMKTLSAWQSHFELTQPISPWTKWPPFRRRYFEINLFSGMKSFIFWLKFHLSLFLRVQLTISQHWFRYWLGAE